MNARDWQRLTATLNTLPELAIAARDAILEDHPHDGSFANVVIACQSILTSWDMAMRGLEIRRRVSV